MRKLTASINRSNTMVIFINQIRMKIGVMYGSPETTTGGHALKFYASVRLDIRRIGAIKERDEVVGNQTRVKVVKNKLAPPFKQVEFDIMYGEGVSKTGELIDLGVKAGVVENRAPGSPTTASASARAARTLKPSSRPTPTSPTRSKPRSGKTPASLPRRSSPARKASATKMTRPRKGELQVQCVALCRRDPSPLAALWERVASPSAVARMGERGEGLLPVLAH